MNLKILVLVSFEIFIFLVFLGTQTTFVSCEPIESIAKDWDFSLGHFAADEGWVNYNYATEGIIDESDFAHYWNIVDNGSITGYVDLYVQDNARNVLDGADTSEYVKINQTMNSYAFVDVQELSVEMKWSTFAPEGDGKLSETTDIDLIIKIGSKKVVIDNYYQNSTVHLGHNESGIALFNVSINEATTSLPLEVYVHAKSIAYEIRYEATIYYVKITGDVKPIPTPGFQFELGIIVFLIAAILSKKYYRNVSNNTRGN